MEMVELIACSDSEQWEEIVAGQARATVFHRWAWLDLIARLSRSRLHAFLISHAGETVGVLPVFLFRRGPFRIAASPPAQVATPVLGPLVPDELLGDSLCSFVREAKRLGASYCEMRSDGDWAGHVLQAAHLDRDPRSTYVLDLGSGAEALWNERFSSACRRAIRKAQAADLTVEEIDLRSCVDRYYELAAGVYAKSDRPAPLSRADYLEIADVTEQSGVVKVLAVRRGPEIVAAGIFPFDNGTVYYLDGVSDPAANPMRPNNLLHWEMIRWASGAGLCRYDMVGAGIPGVARFKQGFGPAEVPYTYCFRNLTPLARLARVTYAALAPATRAIWYRASTLRLKKP